MTAPTALDGTRCGIRGGLRAARPTQIFGFGAKNGWVRDGRVEFLVGRGGKIGAVEMNLARQYDALHNKISFVQNDEIFGRGGHHFRGFSTEGAQKCPRRTLVGGRRGQGLRAWGLDFTFSGA